MVQKKKCSPETKGIWLVLVSGVRQDWQRWVRDLGLKLIFLCMCVYACLYLNFLLSFMILGRIMEYVWGGEVACLGRQLECR